MRRKLILVVSILLLLGGGALTWTLIGWPPPRLVLKYGLSPYCEPTGKKLMVEGVEFIEIGPGCFRMGSHYHCEEGDLLDRLGAILGLDWGTPPKHDSDECPVHWVEFENGFWIAKTEVTNEQYERFDPGHKRSENSPGDQDPVVMVSWEEASGFCAWLAERVDIAIRLPSEAEWECACRAGSRTKFCFGNSEEGLPVYAWFGSNAGGRAREVATRKGNAWGLYDLHGNVSEYCEDRWHGSYLDAPSDGAAWVHGGTLHRIDRGGEWLGPAEFCRSASRSSGPTDYPSPGIGFRPAASSR